MQRNPRLYRKRNVLPCRRVREVLEQRAQLEEQHLVKALAPSRDNLPRAAAKDPEEAARRRAVVHRGVGKVQESNRTARLLRKWMQKGCTLLVKYP